ncbi:MAG: RagB/SusD family nutrient uptake outer membrane protein [Bacteroides sp.]|nr:RagB/SusD family nutrient uptake outer membrane protein [Bacteroides sp.]MCI1683182.1 RagB/SusD family nutrient uptake outer membrane protein [Bacteroides sp.]
MKTNKYIYSCMLAFSLLFTGCSDFLDSTDNSNIAGDNFYQTEEDCKAATAPLYSKVWFHFNDKFYYGMGDGRGYNLRAPYSDYIYPFTDLNESGLTGPLVQAWESFYIVVQQANKVINGIKGGNMSESIKPQYIAEARFMRGVAYYYLAMLWGNVILNENSDELVANPVVAPSPVSDVYEFVMRDLEYAAKYLPETSYATGRVNKYSAFAMLSRIYLTYAGYSDNPNSGTRNGEYLELAKKAAMKVIENKNFGLMDNYADLFKIENNNNKETLFALQWVAKSEVYGESNTIQNYFAYGSDVTGTSKAWGGATVAQPNAIWEYEQGDARRKATWMAYGDFYSELMSDKGGLTFEYSESQLNCKKYVCGSNKDNSNITEGSTPIDTYMIRLGEVYLNYAEAAFGTSISLNSGKSADDTKVTLGTNLSCDDPTAFELYKAIRTRAGLTTKGSSFTFDDLRRERRLELCLEGQYWYDMVRWGYFQQQAVLNYITGQKRDTNIPVLWDSTTQTLSEDTSKDRTQRSVGNVQASIFLLPYPESETVQNPLLKGAPVPYKFTEERITDELFN